MRPVILAGPTASGKSGLALRIAERDGGCVINADALQVYGCWRVLTARPDAGDVTHAPHLLYGHVACTRRYSVGAWLRDVSAALDDARARGLRPVIVGGTGLYLSALTEGLADVPPIGPAWRVASQALIDSDRLGLMLAYLQREDPETLARLDRRNPMRVQRAWEVLRATGRGLAAWQRLPQPALLPRAEADCVVLEMEKSLLTSRIAARLRQMLEDGALEECAAFRAAGHDPALPSARALGRAELTAHLDGALGLEEATALAITATRRFAKRQRTWFRSRMAGWRRIDAGEGDPLAAVSPRSVR